MFECDPDLHEFKANVIEIRALPTGQGIVLNKTLFFPEGGGQPSDRGVLNGLFVASVIEDGETIVHAIDGFLQVGDSIKGTIDWERRFDHMQQHTGQHLLSQVFMRRLDAETVGFHLGAEEVTIDLALENLDEKVAVEIETETNRMVFENRSVLVYEKSAEGLETIPLRKRPVLEGLFRIVEIEHFDWSLCCGTHVHRTGEIGLIKINRWERYKGGIRLYFLCGFRALRAFQKKTSLIRSVSQILTTGENDIVDIVQRWKEERKSTEKRIQTLLNQVMETEAEKLLHKARTFGSVHVVSALFQDKDAQEIQALIRKLVQTDNVVAIVGTIQNRATVFFARSANLDFNMKDLQEIAAIEMNAKGGGGPNWAHCSTDKTEKADAGIKKAVNFLIPTSGVLGG